MTTHKTTDRWFLISFLSGASGGVDPRTVAAWVSHDPEGRGATLQELLDEGLVEIKKQGRYALSKQGQFAVENRRQA